MSDHDEKLTALLASDKRYAPQAYQFVFEALQHVQKKLGRLKFEAEEERHVTGQELCEGIREFALQQFGLMALTVLHSWGVKETADFGQIVFNLIRSGHMRKTDRDTLDDFTGVYRFEEAFGKGFQLESQ